MLTAAIIFTFISLGISICECITVLFSFGLKGLLAWIILVPGIIVNIACLEAMFNEERKISIIVLSFIFTPILAGIFYLIWFVYSSKKKKPIELTIDEEAAKVHWQCSNCGKEVKFVHHCICGHDYIEGVDCQLQEVLVTVPVQLTTGITKL